MDPSGDETHSAHDRSTPAELRDDELAIAVAAGHEPALRQLIVRYDRIVRYTVFRQSQRMCEADPLWLDSVASEVWTGLIRAIRRDRHSLPSTLRNYIISIARNQTISAIRKTETAGRLHTTGLDAASSSQDADAPDPAQFSEDLENLQALRDCLDQLADEDQIFAEHLPDVLDRRWRDVGAALNLPESTVRSRWKRVLGHLRACILAKTGRDFAPGDAADDH